jgi:hypothetical protein
VPKLDATQTAEFVNQLKNPNTFLPPFLSDPLVWMKLPTFLSAIAKEKPNLQQNYSEQSDNIHPLVDLLSKTLKTLLMFDAFYEVEKRAQNGFPNAKRVMNS